MSISGLRLSVPACRAIGAFKVAASCRIWIPHFGNVAYSLSPLTHRCARLSRRPGHPTPTPFAISLTSLHHLRYLHFLHARASRLFLQRLPLPRNLTPPPRARPDRAPHSTRNPRLRPLVSTRLQSHARSTRSATQHGPSAHPLLSPSTQDLTLMRVSLRACPSRAMRYSTMLPSTPQCTTVFVPRVSIRRCVEAKSERSTGQIPRHRQAGCLHGYV
jgi:hypothetical protein